VHLLVQQLTQQPVWLTRVLEPVLVLAWTLRLQWAVTQVRVGPLRPVVVPVRQLLWLQVRLPRLIF
jgi:hypothetical protein